MAFSMYRLVFMPRRSNLNKHLCWMKHIGTASMQKSLHTCSLCLHHWRVPQFALKYPCNPPPPPGRPSLGDRLPPIPPGDRRAQPWEFAGGGGEGMYCVTTQKVHLKFRHETLLAREN